ncbi:unnamed protein product [Mycena citricolor]|uniref:Gaa1-domain-containing protein n=1 Tax=Mycena citricolor TaxID=2018698 RepID=A0AAD2GVY9_9AGAR|nr:unnamed protein product [Mycena citricolor]
MARALDLSLPPPTMDRIRARLRALLNPGDDRSLALVRRRRAMVSALTSRIHLIRLALFVAGYLWMLVLPSPRLGRYTYIDENALQPNSVNTHWNWGDVATADRYLEQLERLRDGNATTRRRAAFLRDEFIKLGIPASTQNYAFHSHSGVVNGTNAYAVLSAPRTSGTEAMVVSASWISRVGEETGTLNLRGVATVLALAHFLKQYSLWAKDFVFIINDGYLDGMQAWLNAYHGSSQSNLQSDNLELTSGVIWTALNIDYPGHSFSHLGIFHEGINGRLPNQDLLNSFQQIARWTGGVPVVVYDQVDTPVELPGWVPQVIQGELGTYLQRAKTVGRHIVHQANGRGSGVHGLFHQFRIDALTIFGVPAQGPHGFHAIGRVLESTLRTTNNLLERLHASFFFYILTTSDWFLKIGSFLPSAVLISVSMMFGGLKIWSDAGWIRDRGDEKSDPQWLERSRPVLPVLAIMLCTHLLGAGLLLGVTNIEYKPVLFAVFSAIPLLALTMDTRKEGDDTASVSSILKALNLCFASTVISITTVVNFSLAMSLAILLGVPLSLSSPTRSVPTKLLCFAPYTVLGLGWLFARHEVAKTVWAWDVLGVWLLPSACIVYTPLVLQAGLDISVSEPKRSSPTSSASELILTWARLAGPVSSPGQQSIS